MAVLAPANPHNPRFFALCAALRLPPCLSECVARGGRCGVAAAAGGGSCAQVRGFGGFA
jgi:hypothetical protein